MSDELEHAARVGLSHANCPKDLIEGRIALVTPHLGIADDGDVVVLDKNGNVRERHDSVRGVVRVTVVELIQELCETRGRGRRSEMAWPR